MKHLILRNKAEDDIDRRGFLQCMAWAGAGMVWTITGGMDQVLKGARTKEIFYVPGEYDTSVNDGKEYRERYGKNTKGNGWYSFDHKGVHFVGLVNVMQVDGMGQLSQEQLHWLEDDLRGRSSSTPVVVFAHIPLWSVYLEWGWSTQNSAQALSYLKRFGSVTVLNGHIHQVMQKVEGNVTFHTAMSTAFPQAAPGAVHGLARCKCRPNNFAGFWELPAFSL